MLRPVITKPFLAILLAVSAFALTGLPQEETKEKTFTRDELDAILVAGRFSREMQRTKDLRPLIAKYGVPNYGLWIAGSKDAFEKELLSPEFAAKVSPQMMLDLEVAVANWLYLQTVWELQQVDYQLLSKFPPKIKALFRSDPYLSQLVKHDYDDENRITSKDELFRVIRTLERAAILYRGYLQRYPRVKTKTYLSNLADATDEGKLLYKPEMGTCNKEFFCLGIPKGTPYFSVVIEPMTWVILVRSPGKMKIAYVISYNPD